MLRKLELRLSFLLGVVLVLLILELKEVPREGSEVSERLKRKLKGMALPLLSNWLEALRAMWPVSELPKAGKSCGFDSPKCL